MAKISPLSLVRNQEVEVCAPSIATLRQRMHETSPTWALNWDMNTNKSRAPQIGQEASNVALASLPLDELKCACGISRAAGITMCSSSTRFEPFASRVMP